MSSLELMMPNYRKFHFKENLQDNFVCKHLLFYCLIKDIMDRLLCDTEIQAFYAELVLPRAQENGGIGMQVR